MHRFLMVFICCSLLIGFVPQAAEANSTSSRLSSNESQNITQTLYVDARAPEWTDTNVVLEAGDTVRIQATGRMSFGPVTGCDPDGNCTERQLGTVLAGNMNQSGLIVAPSGAFAVGSSYTSEGLTGRLYLGIGDSAYGDNSGGFNVTVTVERDDPGGPGDKSNEGCPANSSATTNYAWTLIYRDGTQGGNSVNVPIATVKMQTRFCVDNISGTIVDIADDHEEYERMYVWVLEDQEAYWSVTTREIKCNYNQGTSQVVCDGTHDLSSRFGGEVSIGLELSGPIASALTAGFTLGGTVTMSPYSREYYTHVIFAGSRDPRTGALYTSPGVINFWILVNSQSNGPLCPSSAPLCPIQG